MKYILTITLLLLSTFSFGQHLKNGVYYFSIREAEYQNHPIVGKCKVIIKGDHITMYYMSGNLNLKKGELFDKGTLMLHPKSKNWIIGHSPNDKNAPEVGGCSDGPRVIDLKKKEICSC